MKIGELARLTGIPIETIRYYEKEKLLPEINRTGSNYRIYSEQHAERLRFIRNCRSLDMTLDEIRILLHFKDKPDESCVRVNALLDEHIGHVRKRIQELKKLESQLQILRNSCQETKNTADCGILHALSCPATLANKGNPICSHICSTHAGNLPPKGGKTR